MRTGTTGSCKTIFFNIPRETMARKNKPQKSPSRGFSKHWGWVLIIGALALFSAIVLWPEGNDSGISDAPDDLALGKALYAKNCAACHGPNAEGQDVTQRMGGQRPDGTYIAPGLNGSAHSWHHPPEMLFRIVKFGSPAPGSTMVGWKDKMSDPEIKAVLSYLQSIWPEELRINYRKQHMMNGS